MDNTFILPDAPEQVGQFERYVQELCYRCVAAQLQQILQDKASTQIDHNEKFMTKREAARLIGKGEKMIDNYRKKGMPAHMFGRTPMFLESEVLSFIEASNRKSHKE